MQIEAAAARTAATDGLVVALDIGGTKIAGALVDDRGTLLVRAQRPTPAAEDAESVMRAVSEVIGELAADPRRPLATAVGIGSAGPVDASSGTVSPVNVPGWRDFPLVQRVREATGGLPVVLTGDGVAITAAEHWQGAARGYDNALCMVVSTGVGGGFVLGGVLHPGPTGNAGHIGHISVDLDGDPCPCGARGCVERIASGPNIARRALDGGWRPPEGVEATAAAVAESARAGDPVARASFVRAAQALAAGIAAAATLVEIQVAVVGGGVAGAGELLFGPLREQLRRYATLSFAAGVKVVPAQLGTDAGLVGAAAAAFAAPLVPPSAGPYGLAGGPRAVLSA
ncbi:ROK family protein [Streptomyces sp. RB6PN25]|uniref:ROK family protein n=1 Tax=Streptomyces humicola TaxID=2953240 RepID=A0ABT1Q134_9ACTN|nr:ROK family protein [Streptomyces humicola]MCQ4083622.1 ROK family protein [Streptomyces humicola]